MVVNEQYFTNKTEYAGLLKKIY